MSTFRPYPFQQPQAPRVIIGTSLGIPIPSGMVIGAAYVRAYPAANYQIEPGIAPLIPVAAFVVRPAALPQPASRPYPLQQTPDFVTVNSGTSLDAPRPQPPLQQAAFWRTPYPSQLPMLADTATAWLPPSNEAPDRSTRVLRGRWPEYPAQLPMLADTATAWLPPSNEPPRFTPVNRGRGPEYPAQLPMLADTATVWLPPSDEPPRFTPVARDQRPVYPTQVVRTNVVWLPPSDQPPPATAIARYAAIAYPFQSWQIDIAALIPAAGTPPPATLLQPAGQPWRAVFLPPPVFTPSGAAIAQASQVQVVTGVTPLRMDTDASDLSVSIPGLRIDTGAMDVQITRFEVGGLIIDTDILE